MSSELHDTLVDLIGDLPSPPDDMTVWHLRQAIVREMRKDGDAAVADQCDSLVDDQYEQFEERLYELPNAYLLVEREADQGWSYALYNRAKLCSYALADGGGIDGHAHATIDEVAAAAAQLMGIADSPMPSNKTFAEFSEFVDTEPDAVIRGVRVFLSPQLKKAGIGAVPGDVIARVREQIDLRLARPILLVYDTVKGFAMHQIDVESAPDAKPYEVELPDCTGLLYLDGSASGEQVGDYDADWARSIWLDPVFIDRIGGQVVADVG